MQPLTRHYFDALGVTHDTKNIFENHIYAALAGASVPAAAAAEHSRGIAERTRCACAGGLETASTALDTYDDPRDQRMIKFGYDLYKQEDTK